MSTNTPTPDEDKELVNLMLFHMANPCGTEHGNIRSFYIRESERLIEKNIVKDTIQLERLKTAINMAKLLLKIEKS